MSKLLVLAMMLFQVLRSGFGMLQAQLQPPPQPSRPVQPHMGAQQLPTDPWATPDPLPSNRDGSQAFQGAQQPWQGQGGAQHAQRGPQHAQHGPQHAQRGQGHPSWQGPARKPYMPHLVGQEGMISQQAQQAGPGATQRQNQAPQSQGQGAVAPAPGLQLPSHGAPSHGQGLQKAQGQRPNRRSSPQSQRASQGQPPQQSQAQSQAQGGSDSRPTSNMPQQQRSGQGTRRQVVPINPSPAQGQEQGASQQPHDSVLPPPPPPPRGSQKTGQGQPRGQGSSKQPHQETLPPRADGPNASSQLPAQQQSQSQGQGCPGQAQPSAPKEERSGDFPRRERRGKGRDRSSRDRYVVTRILWTAQCAHMQAWRHTLPVMAIAVRIAY